MQNNQFTLPNLSPLIRATEKWLLLDSPLLIQAWLANDGGKLVYSEEKPDTVFCSVLLVENLDTVETPMKFPTCYVEWPSGRHALVYPTAWMENPPLIGRIFSSGTWDCYTLVVDYMKRELGADMLPLAETLTNVQNAFIENSAFEVNEELGKWEQVVIPQPGDGILFSMTVGAMSPERANHCGVYLGETFLHHLPARASCEEIFNTAWKNKVVAFMRYTGNG